jgi:lipopolysaccharide export system protein LptA
MMKYAKHLTINGITREGAGRAPKVRPTLGRAERTASLQAPDPAQRGHAQKIISIIALAAFLLLGNWAQAQGSPEQDSSSQVQILFSNQLEVTPEAKILKGLVHLRQGDADMYSDTVKMFNETFLTAYNEVLITQPDSVFVFADSLAYQSDIRFAELFGNVSLQDRDATLFTDRLDYDLNTKLGKYLTGGLITKGEMQLSSQRCYYYVDSSMAYFSGDVKMDHPDFRLVADTLGYNTQREIAYFIGPTDMYNDDKHIYCEDGYYDTRNKYAIFEKNAYYESDSADARADQIIYDGRLGVYTLNGNAYFEDSSKVVTADIIRYYEAEDRYEFIGKPVFQDKNSPQSIVAENSSYDKASNTMIFSGNVVMSDSSQVLTTDTLRYNRSTHWAYARGNVVWVDSVNQTLLEAGLANYNDSTGYLFATQKPIMSSVIEGDSLFIRADTLISYFDTLADSTRTLIAYRHVRFYKSDFQGRCDSMSFSGLDSVFHFYDEPIIWADTTQFTADTIAMTMKNQQISFVDLRQRSFLVNLPDSIFYNQISGTDIKVRFANNQVQNMNVDDEGETIYYVQDDQQRYVAVNKTICEDMLVEFGNNKVEKIRFYTSPKAVLYPMRQVNHATLKLDGFIWKPSLKPLSKQDLEPIIEYSLKP